MKLMGGSKFKRQVAPNIFKRYEVIGKNQNGNWVVEDLSDGQRYIEPFLDGKFCLPLDDSYGEIVKDINTD